MKWKNAVRDSLPPASGNVVLSLRGVNYTAFYDADKRVFHVSNDEGEFILGGDYDQIYWTEKLK